LSAGTAAQGADWCPLRGRVLFHSRAALRGRWAYLKGPPWRAKHSKSSGEA
jgi:hypothetical protein